MTDRCPKSGLTSVRNILQIWKEKIRSTRCSSLANLYDGCHMAPVGGPDESGETQKNVDICLRILIYQAIEMKML